MLTAVYHPDCSFLACLPCHLTFIWSFVLTCWCFFLFFSKTVIINVVCFRYSTAMGYLAPVHPQLVSKKHLNQLGRYCSCYLLHLNLCIKQKHRWNAFERVCATRKCLVSSDAQWRGGKLMESTPVCMALVNSCIALLFWAEVDATVVSSRPPPPPPPATLQEQTANWL